MVENAIEYIQIGSDEANPPNLRFVLSKDVCAQGPMQVTEEQNATMTADLGGGICRHGPQQPAKQSTRHLFGSGLDEAQRVMHVSSLQASRLLFAIPQFSTCILLCSTKPKGASHERHL